jgi:hypothetical protein
MPTLLGRVATPAWSPNNAFRLRSRICPHEARRSGPRLGIRTGFSASQGGLLWSDAQSICPRLGAEAAQDQASIAKNRTTIAIVHLPPPSHGARSPAVNTADTAPLSTAALDPQSNADPKPNSDLRQALRTVPVESSLPAYSSRIIVQPQKIP